MLLLTEVLICCQNMKAAGYVDSEISLVARAQFVTQGEEEMQKAFLVRDAISAHALM